MLELTLLFVGFLGGVAYVLCVVDSFTDRSRG